VIYPHTVTVHPSELTTDGDGNPVRRPAAAGVDVPAYVQPAPAGESGAAELLDAPQTATEDYRVWLDATCPPLDAWSALVWEGVTYELLGAAQRLTSPDGALDHVRAQLRRR
jgi:hypothetical protein